MVVGSVSFSRRRKIEKSTRQFRVRHHDTIARLEVQPDDFELVVERHEEIVARLKELGYIYVTLDLQGFRSGSMNEARRAPAQEITLVV